MNTISLTVIRFPRNQLLTRDAHKLRGYFGNLFREHSHLLHNHLENGKLRYAYPLVQYKVLNGIPTLVGIAEGGRLLEELYNQVRYLDIEGFRYPVHDKTIAKQTIRLGISQQVRHYRFQTLWMALNQENYQLYANEGAGERGRRLSRILTGNILMFFRDVGVLAEEDILVVPQVQEKTAKFKDKKMLAFKGGFAANVLLPEGIGLGKAVARGFGTVSLVGEGISGSSLNIGGR